LTDWTEKLYTVLGSRPVNVPPDASVCGEVATAGVDETKYDVAPVAADHVITADVWVGLLDAGAAAGAGESVLTLFVVTVELLPAELTAVIVKLYVLPGVRVKNVADVPLIPL
jgi:hypothetical protein